jgi:hypothetical protein
MNEVVQAALVFGGIVFWGFILFCAVAATSEWISARAYPRGRIRSKPEWTLIDYWNQK